MKSSKLPIQAAPVERTITGARISSPDGVEASGASDAQEWVIIIPPSGG